MNAFDVQKSQDGTAAPTQQPNNDTLYEKILLNKELEANFFADSSTDEEEDSVKPID